MYARRLWCLFFGREHKRNLMQMSGGNQIRKEFNISLTPDFIIIMVATKRVKIQPTLKQSTLSFASKRAHSSKVNEKKKKASIRKTGSAPVPVQAKEEEAQAKRPNDPLEISSDSETETETETERPTSKSVKAAKTVVPPTPPAVEEVARERLNAKDRKWNKHYATVKATMGGLPAGEQSSLRSCRLAEA